MAELRVSELPTAVTLDDSDLLLLSQPDANSDTGYASAKTTNVALATKIAKNTSFGDLATTSKKLIGAINELKGKVGAQDLADLDDVNVTTPAAGECLQYNGTSQKWENKDILAVNETTLTEPYVYKQVPNGKYTEKLKKLIGASVVWNQLVDTNTTSVTITSGHKYIHWNGSTLTKATSDGTAISVTGGTDKIYDISAMFGNDTAAIAITTARFAELFPDYTSYAYSANTIQSVSVSGHKVVGKNLFNSQTLVTAGATVSDGVYTFAQGRITTKTKLCDVPNPNIQYVFRYKMKTSTTATNLYLYIEYTDGTNTRDVSNGTANNWNDRILVSNSSKTIAGIYANVYSSTKETLFKDIQLEIGSTATAYEPYHEETESLDHTTLRGIFKLDANNNLYADGDIYNADGSEDVKYEERAYASGDESLPDTITDGTTTVTKKATPTTATLTPFNPLSVIEQGGTEEFVDYGVQQGTRDVAIPPGNESAYGDNKLMAQIIKYINN